MELSKLKRIQRYMNPFELDYIKYERHPQSQQLSTTFIPTIKELFETLETSDIYMTSSHSIIEPIVNRDFGNMFQHHNGPNQRQQTHKTPFASTNTETLVNIINLDPFKYLGPHQSHT